MPEASVRKSTPRPQRGLTWRVAPPTQPGTIDRLSHRSECSYRNAHLTPQHGALGPIELLLELLSTEQHPGDVTELGQRAAKIQAVLHPMTEDQHLLAGPQLGTDLVEHRHQLLGQHGDDHDRRPLDGRTVTGLDLEPLGGEGGQRVHLPPGNDDLPRTIAARSHQPPGNGRADVAAADDGDTVP